LQCTEQEASVIYKDIDNKEPFLAVLEKMLALAGPDKKAQIERTLRIMRAGIKGERASGHFIDTCLKDSTRTAVVHDLRLVADDGEVAQIDHLLVHRMGRFTVLNTRLFADGVRISERGEFLRWNETEDDFKGMPSPLVQNERHARVLRQVLETIGQGEAAIESLVLVAPDARVERPRRFDTSMVMKPEQFMEKLNRALEGAPIVSALGGLLKSGTSDSIGDIARKLVQLHRPSATDYLARFGILRGPAQPSPPASAAGLYFTAPQ
jgi:hypothetical protein